MEYMALYRQFRPLKFEEIVGQEHITTTLKNQIMAERVGHAYLFNGGRGTGKTSAAKVLARAINCENPKDGEPCNECEICKKALSGALTDIIEMDAASNNGVDDIRKIREEVNFLPTLAKYKVYIIDEVHMLSSGAFNALLKTLEEPPKHVKFILATTEPQKVPVTILSRCQRFNFKKISNENIMKRLKYVCDKSEISISPQALKIIAVLSEGAMRDALSILERCIQDGDKNIEEEKVKELVGIPSLEYTHRVSKAIIEYDFENALKTIEEVSKQGKEIEIFIWEIIKYIKDILIYKTSKNLEIYSENEIKQIDELANVISKERLLNIIYELSEMENNVRKSSQKMIMFQAGIIKLCTNKIDNTTGNEEIAQRISNLETVVKKIVKGNININAKNVDNAPTKNKPISFNDSMVEGNCINKTENPSMNMESTQTYNLNKNINNSNINEMKTQTKNNTNNTNTDFSEWKDIISELKDENKKILYSNLMNTNASIINDMTVGISSRTGFNAMNKLLLEKPENIYEIEKRVSMKLGKPMKIKYIQTPKKQEIPDNDFESLVKSLDIPIDIMD